ncbi:PRTRC system protein B [Massilia sp. BJB1822]|uniref:PRTRC system protein B n=1 Tax=Massilia sp. BJB1822 TaxID=2744470 RepID=UPI0015941846|nr:PRTRC system protein B [Massilia sp. BJB1822]NVE00680.1 PRTRC system protein B [Massilia sp. BJB1822]
MHSAQCHLRLGDTGSLQLSDAVLIYRTGGPHPGRTYASVHRIDTTSGRPVLLAGKPMTPRSALSLAQELTRQVGHAGFLPGSVLYADGDALIWWCPPQRRHIAFRSGDPLIGERGAEVPHPALVFFASGSQWRVWALKGSHRPTPDSPLYRAPYFNVYEDGGICRGNVILPSGPVADQLAAWETAFFSSLFTHPNVRQGLLRFPGGAHAFWRAQLDQRFQRFPQRVLVPLNMTLNALAARHLHGARDDVHQRGA